MDGYFKQEKREDVKFSDWKETRKINDVDVERM